MEELELIKRARSHGDSIAIRSASSERSYTELLDRSETLAAALLAGAGNLDEARIAYLVPAGCDYVAVQWAIWRAGGVAVPLCLSAAERELEYTLTDSGSRSVVTTRELAKAASALCERLGITLRMIDESRVPPARPLPELEPQRRAMILYTSGTTSTPKGAVTTHANIQSQIETLIEAWDWRSSDSIPLFLPLHHIHGIINVLSCALWAGATIEPFARFDASSLLDRVADGAYSVFMAVPTIYVKLIEAVESLREAERARVLAGFRRMRLMVSGSAALPASVHEAWTALTGQKLLERYGMTEIGMALSNPLRGERRPGSVGQPLPGVELRLTSENGAAVTAEGEPGEIQVRGPAVFREYWNRPDATKEAFVEDDWFRTGDMAVLENGSYRIMGRLSVDIFKSGGYKLSALEIEAALLEHPAIRECAVVGIANDTWGELVAAAVVARPGDEPSLETLQSWCRDRLSAYKIPRRLLVVDGLPRNAMGKITKPAVQELFDELSA